MALTEADLLGRRIDKLFVSGPIALAANIQTQLYTVGRSPNIVPSPTTGGGVINYVQVAILTGGALANSSIGFGITAGGTTWNNGYFNFNLFAPSPVVFYSDDGPTRPGIIAAGTPFYVNCDANAWTASTTAQISLYGWTL